MVCLGDFNGHMGRHIDGFHGRYGVGQRKLEGRMFCFDMNYVCKIHGLGESTRGR